MKCLFCGDTVVSTQYGCSCPKCKTQVHMKAKQLMVPPTAPRYLSDSFSYLQALAKEHPDIAMSEAPLFSSDFDVTKTLAIFKDKKCFGGYQFPYKSTSFSTTANVPENWNIVTVNDVVNFEFTTMLASNMSAVGSYPMVPLLTLKACNASRFLWQAFVAKNAYESYSEDILTAVNDLGQFSVLDYYEEYSFNLPDEALVLSAAAHYDDRFKAIRTNNGDWLNAVTKYYSDCVSNNVKISSIEVYNEKFNSLLDGIGVNTRDQSHLLNELLLLYDCSDITLRELVCSDGLCALNPEKAGGFDTFIFDALKSKEYQHNAIAMRNRMSFYAKLYDAKLGNGNTLACTLEEAVARVWHLTSFLH